MQQFIASRRQRMSVSLTVALAAVGAGHVTLTVADAPPGGQTPPNSGDSMALYLEPVVGLTTARYLAPPAVSVPLGTVLRFTQAVPEGLHVVWDAALPLDVSTDEFGETIRCPLNTLGQQIVSTRVVTADGTTVQQNSCTLEVLELSLDDIKVEPIQVWVDPVDLRDDLTNEETMDLFLSAHSIAQLYEQAHRLGGLLGSRQFRGSPLGKLRSSSEIPHRFTTSIQRPIEFHAAVDPEGMAPLIEWRIDGDGVQLGTSTGVTFSDIGQHTVSVGPSRRPSQVDIEIYRVEITSHQSMTDTIDEAEPVTFTAVTHPPGFEDDITWVSTTKFGTAYPVLGSGPSFTVTFEDTFGDDPVDEDWQWLGVKADNAVFGQEQKPGACCNEDGECIEVVVAEECADSDIYFPGVACDTGICVAQPVSPLDLPNVGDPDEVLAAIPIRMAPIDGWTTSWHTVPRELTLPVGTDIKLLCPVPESATVIWTGVTSTALDLSGSTARRAFDAPGSYVIEARIVLDEPLLPPSSGTELTWTSTITVVDVPIGGVEVAIVEVSVEPLGIDLTAPQDELNSQTVSLFFGKSIADIRDLGNDTYRTSTDREVSMTVRVNPPAFASLIEWRIDGTAEDLGASWMESWNEAGTHLIEVGPPDGDDQIQLEIYSVSITSHGNHDIIPQGPSVTLTAVTDPPGYEDDITWLSSTKFGTATPVLGSGPTFTVQFDDTFGPHADGSLSQWLGVKADNAVFGQDQKQKTGGCCLPEDACTDAVTFGECEVGLGGVFQGADSLCGCDTECAVGSCGSEVTLSCDAACTINCGGDTTEDGFKMKVTWRCCPNGQCNGVDFVTVKGNDACGVIQTDSIENLGCTNTSEGNTTGVVTTICWQSAATDNIDADVKCCSGTTASDTHHCD